MQVKEVAALAAVLLGRNSLATAVGGAGSSVTGEMNTLLRCYNLVENEIALDYFPLKRVESFVPQDGRIYFTRFSNTPVNVHRVTVGGVAVKYELFPAYLTLPKDAGEAEVTYSYSPAQKTYVQESEFSGKISSRLMAYGVACEFCLANGDYNAAATWEVKFREALRSAGILRRTLSMRSRRWA